MPQDVVEQLYQLMHLVVWVHTPQDQRWMLPIFVLVLVITPAWLAWHLLRFLWSALARWRQQHARKIDDDPINAKNAVPSLERFVLRTTAPFQIRLAILSVLTIPATYILLLLPKHIINYALADDGPKFEFLRARPERVERLGHS